MEPSARKKAAMKAYAQAHPERIKAIHKAWELRNPEKAKALRRSWRVRSPEKNNAMARRFYQKHREEVIQKKVTAHHQQLLALDAFKKSCQICGEQDVRCLDFHHRNPSEKSFSITSGIRSMDELMNEIGKCDVLCANCHRKLHSKRERWT